MRALLLLCAVCSSAAFRPAAGPLSGRPVASRAAASSVTMRHKDYYLRVARAESGRMRLCIKKTNNHMYAQVIDDSKGFVLATASTLEKNGEGEVDYGGNCAAAVAVGERVASRALDKGITQVFFDRNGYKYHGRVAAVADAAREKGLDF